MDGERCCWERGLCERYGEKLGIKAMGREVGGVNGFYELREPVTPYGAPQEKERRHNWKRKSESDRIRKEVG